MARFYQQSDSQQWDAFLPHCLNSTFLHSRRFLGYHRARFQDRSILVFSGERLVGVLPLAIDPKSSNTVVSHPGLSFGGLLHGRELQGEKVIEAFSVIRNLLTDSGFSTLIYRPVPALYHRMPALDDLYALFRMGATRVRSELSAAIYLDGERHLRKGRKSGLSKAKREGLVVREGREHLAQFWPLLTAQLNARHQAQPTHSLAEISELAELFPQAIQVFVVAKGEEIIGGTVLFNSKHVVHVQYLSANQQGFQLGAADLLIATAIGRARDLKARAFDLGTSCENQGKYLNEGLHEFKVGFGAGGYTFDSWSVDLEAQPR